MADINTAHATPPATEADGINYRGLFWFAVILFGTVVVCQVLMLVMLRMMQTHADATLPAAAPYATPVGAPPPPPDLLTDEPGNLATFRAQEDQQLTTYGWIDKNAGTVRLPIDRAKDLLLERGIPGGQPMTETTPGAATTPAKTTTGGGGK